jgi:small-conductance mechanosensitive channel
MWQNTLQAFYFLLGSFLVGLLIQKWVIARLHSVAQRTKWKWDDVVANSLGKLPIIWFLCAGGYCYLVSSKLSPSETQLAHKILISVLIFTGMIFIGRFASGSIELLTGRTQSRLPSTTLISNITRLLIYILGGILILQNLEIKITPMITALGIGGLAVALALEETLSNLIAGVQIIASQLVRPGDYVKLDAGYEGYVTDVKARNTTIRSFPDNNRIIVPNCIMASSIVINYSLPEESLWVDVAVGVAYDSNLEHVEEVTLDIARQVCESVEGGIPGHEPFLRYEEFGDSSINFRVRMFVKAFQDQFLIKHSFIKLLHQRFNEVGIEIPFPIRTIHVKREEADMVPDSTIAPRSPDAGT